MPRAPGRRPDIHGTIGLDTDDRCRINTYHTLRVYQAMVAATSKTIRKSATTMAGSESGLLLYILRSRLVGKPAWLLIGRGTGSH